MFAKKNVVKSVLCFSLMGALLNCGGSSEPEKKTEETPSTTETSFTCSGDCNDFVINKLVIPMDESTAKSVARDYNGDGVPDNAFGALMTAFIKPQDTTKTQETANHMLNRGLNSMLMRFKATSLSSDNQARIQVAVGEDQACCSNATDRAACASEAAQKCFSGSGEFSVAGGGKFMKGQISGGQAVFGPGELNVKLPVTLTDTIVLNLKNAYITANLSSDRLSGGKITGVITQESMDNEVIPSVAEMFDRASKNPDFEEGARNFVKSFFDLDKNGTIDATDLKNNALMGTIMKGDVDTDNDGKKELSVGIGFEAVKAVIK